jgi:hypothetical protein
VQCLPIPVWIRRSFIVESTQIIRTRCTCGTSSGWSDKVQISSLHNDLLPGSRPRMTTASARSLSCRITSSNSPRHRWFYSRLAVSWADPTRIRTSSRSSRRTKWLTSTSTIGSTSNSPTRGEIVVPAKPISRCADRTKFLFVYWIIRKVS